MPARFLIVLLAIAVLALPAAVPASQPAGSRIIDPAPAAAPVPSPSDPGLLRLDPHRTPELSMVLPKGFTTLEMINEDPFRG